MGTQSIMVWERNSGKHGRQLATPLLWSGSRETKADTQPFPAICSGQDPGPWAGSNQLGKMQTFSEIPSMQRCMPVVILHPVNLIMGVHQHKWCANFMPKTFLSNQTGAGVNLTCKLQFVDLIVKQLSFKFLCLCLSRGTLYQPVCGGQRLSCRSGLSPSTTWVSEIKLRSPALVASHSAGPLNNDFSWIFLKSNKYKDTIAPGPEVIRS